MSPGNHDDDPILNVGDLGWWLLFGFLGSTPVLYVMGIDWNPWLVVPAGLAVGVAQRPLTKRYTRRAEAARRSRSAAERLTNDERDR